MIASLPASLIERARATRIEDEIERRGIKLVGRVDRCGPCPQCGGTDRFAINVRKQCFNCRGCGASGDVIALAMFLDGCGFAEAVTRLAGASQTAVRASRASPSSSPKMAASDDASRIRNALEIWKESGHPRETPVERYLELRGLTLTADVTWTVIRWNERIGSMVALFRNIETDAPQAISRTYLDRESRKIDRKFLGPVGGTAIKLDADDTVLSGLHIGEGIETCLAARQLGLRPTWALGSSGGVKSTGEPFGGVAAFPVLDGIECLTVLAENDEGRSARAVEACAARWHAAGREVIINEPIVGKDLNDAIRLRSAS